LRRFKHLAPFLRQALQETIAAPAVDLPSVLVKDACYAAIACGSYELQDEIDFSGWYLSSLSREIEVYSHPGSVSSFGLPLFQWLMDPILLLLLTQLPDIETKNCKLNRSVGLEVK